jgi:hypothetical protein
MPLFKTSEERQAYEKAKKAKLQARKASYLQDLHDEMVKRGYKPEDASLRRISNVSTYIWCDEHYYNTWDQNGSGLLKLSFKCTRAKRQYTAKEHETKGFNIQRIADKLEEQIKHAQHCRKAEAKLQAERDDLEANAERINKGLGLTPFESPAWAKTDKGRITIRLPFDIKEDEVCAILTLIKGMRE